MTLHQEFVKTAKRRSKQMMIVDRSTEKSFTYSRGLIASLILHRKLAAVRDGFVGVMIPNSAGAMLSILGLLMAGKVPVLINYSTGAAENAEYAQKKCGFKTILTSRTLLEKIRCPLIPGMIFIEEIMAKVSALDKLQASFLSKLPLNMLLKKINQGESDDNLVILFTSGSEKEPKAVQLTHRNIGSNVAACSQALGIADDDIMLANLPLFHVFGFNVNFWLPIYNGITMVSYANPLEYKKIATICREERVTLMVATPSFFAGYLKQSEKGDFASIRVAVAGADKTPDSLREGYKKKHDLELFEGYGTTETSPVVSVNLPGRNKPGSIGQVLANVQVRITDINSGEVLPTGKEGKILVKGDLVMKGYFDDFEETSLRIKDGWYETGDMGLFDEDGYLWHRGRLKRFVKIGGEMVSLVRVESLLETLLPEDCECCVVEVPDSLKGARIVAAVTKQINEKDILKKLAEKIPAIAMPRRFLLLPDLPKMGSGKIDFRAVTEKVRDYLQNSPENS